MVSLRLGSLELASGMLMFKTFVVNKLLKLLAFSVEEKQERI